MDPKRVHFEDKKGVLMLSPVAPRQPTGKSWKLFSALPDGTLNAQCP